MASSKAFLVEPETSPSQEVDRRVYMLGNRACPNVASAKVNVPSGTGNEALLSAGLTDRQKLYVKNLSGNSDIYIGPSGVTSTSGYLIRNKEEIWLDVTEDCEIYAIAASGSSNDVRVFEVAE